MFTSAGTRSTDSALKLRYNGNRWKPARKRFHLRTIRGAAGPKTAEFVPKCANAPEVCLPASRAAPHSEVLPPTSFRLLQSGGGHHAFRHAALEDQVGDYRRESG
ncbi:hypothetical protein GCM10008957_34350 [Deinococcus ruber]|uniref:Uncharacterized protein n=1 Tax=Deinococcus ruber TaxID=1848197 RepID=A0A918CE00_9DEIO|nr:hypothetical protein GCM10008957_34350 [Deinococcus ruber]